LTAQFLQLPYHSLGLPLSVLDATGGYLMAWNLLKALLLQPVLLLEDYRQIDGDCSAEW